MVNIIKTNLDKFYLGQVHDIRVIRSITDPDARNKALQVLIDNGTIPMMQVNIMVRVVAWQENVDAVVGDDVIATITPNPDLYQQSVPFGLVNKEADPNSPDQVGTYYNLLDGDISDIGSIYQDNTNGNFYQKLLKVADSGTDTTFYLDWSLLGMTPYWVRVESVQIHMKTYPAQLPLKERVIVESVQDIYTLIGNDVYTLAYIPQIGVASLVPDLRCDQDKDRQTIPVSEDLAIQAIKSGMLGKLTPDRNNYKIGYREVGLPDGLDYYKMIQ